MTISSASVEFPSVNRKMIPSSSQKRRGKSRNRKRRYRLSLGFDASFQRLWDYYLASCEGAFRERYIGVVQMLLAKRNTQRPLLQEPWSTP